MAKRTESRSALDALAEQQAHIDSLFDQVQRDQLDRAAAFAELVESLSAHLGIIDCVVFPRIALDQMRHLVRAAGEHHRAIRHMLSEVLAYDFEEDGFAAKLAVLRRGWRRACEDQQLALVPALRRSVAPAKLAELGDQLVARWRELVPSAAGHLLVSVDDDLALSA